MKTIIIVDPQHDNDICRIISIMLKHNLICTYEQAKEMWKMYSRDNLTPFINKIEEWRHVWIPLFNDDEEIFKCLKLYFLENGEQPVTETKKEIVTNYKTTFSSYNPIEAFKWIERKVKSRLY